jgi:hypothetical protein
MIRFLRVTAGTRVFETLDLKSMLLNSFEPLHLLLQLARLLDQVYQVYQRRVFRLGFPYRATVVGKPALQTYIYWS